MIRFNKKFNSRKNNSLNLVPEYSCDKNTGKTYICGYRIENEPYGKVEMNGEKIVYCDVELMYDLVKEDVVEKVIEKNDEGEIEPNDK